MNLLMFLGGLALLVVGANLLVRGASRLALSLGISPLVVGLTIVATGTSAPEVAVSIGAALGGKTDIAVGNVVGSNIFNVLVILGVGALIAPSVVNIQLIRQEVPVMIGASLLLVALGLDGTVSWIDGGILFTLFVGYTALLILQSRRNNKAVKNKPATSRSAKRKPDRDADPDRPTESAAWDQRLPVQLLMIGAGLAALVLGAEYLVQASVDFARVLGVSDLIIGLTIVAGGTGMPEAATSIAAAFRGQRDIAVGNVVGSNIFNILGCLGLSALASGSAGLGIPASLMAFDLWVMLVVALACLPIFLTGKRIARWEGAIFVGYYIAYVTWLILAAQQHEALPAFSGVMLGFVVPLTALTLMLMIRRPGAARQR